MRLGKGVEVPTAVSSMGRETKTTSLSGCKCFAGCWSDPESDMELTSTGGREMLPPGILGGPVQSGTATGSRRPRLRGMFEPQASPRLRQHPASLSVGVQAHLRHTGTPSGLQECRIETQRQEHGNFFSEPIGGWSGASCIIGARSI